MKISESGIQGNRGISTSAFNNILRLGVAAVLLLALAEAGNFENTRNQFVLGSTPFIPETSLSVDWLYGLNQGQPALVLQQWHLPDYERRDLFYNQTGRVSLVGKYSIQVVQATAYARAFNSEKYLPDGQASPRSYAGLALKRKFNLPLKRLPKMALELQSLYTFSLSAGSNLNRLQYYVSTDWMVSMLYFPLPFFYSAGVLYKLTDWISMVGEGHSTLLSGGSPIAYHSYRSSLSFAPTKYFSFDIGMFYFDFDFDRAIPHRDMMVWKSPDYVISAPEKSSYFLFSSSLCLHLNRE